MQRASPQRRRFCVCLADCSWLPLGVLAKFPIFIKNKDVTHGSVVRIHLRWTWESTHTHWCFIELLLLLLRWIVGSIYQCVCVRTFICSMVSSNSMQLNSQFNKSHKSSIKDNDTLLKYGHPFRSFSPAASGMHLITMKTNQLHCGHLSHTVHTVYPTSRTVLPEHRQHILTSALIVIGLGSPQLKQW